MSKLTALSWGLYPRIEQTLHRVSWRNELKDELDFITHAFDSTLAFGNGRSYGDSCLASSSHVLAMQPLNRFIAADWETGCITVEAGITLGDILALAIPRGWFLAVTPGTQFVTVGGAVANDVHGKNHHVKGTMGRYVRGFKLIRSDREPLYCSRTEHADLFAATIGGLGLTGVIEWVELELAPIQSNLITTKTIRFESLDEFFALSAEQDSKHEYSVAWVDCLAKGDQLGRGVFMVGDHASEGELITRQQSKITVPFTPPISLVNSLTLKAFNTAYYHRHPENWEEKAVYYEPFFYPLDRILQWNRLYGRKGFQQYQCVIPEVNAKAAIHALLETISAAGQGSFLAVLKRCGDIPSPGLMSFPLPGVSLALDFSQTGRLCDLFSRMDDIVREANGRLYPAKDAHMSGEDFRRNYPAWEQVAALRDPALCSLFWKRVTT